MLLLAKRDDVRKISLDTPDFTDLVIEMDYGDRQVFTNYEIRIWPDGGTSYLLINLGSASLCILHSPAPVLAKS